MFHTVHGFAKTLLFRRCVFIGAEHLSPERKHSAGRGGLSVCICAIEAILRASVSRFPPTPTQGSVCVHSKGSGFLEWSVSAGHNRPILHGIRKFNLLTLPGYSRQKSSIC